MRKQTKRQAKNTLRRRASRRHPFITNHELGSLDENAQRLLTAFALDLLRRYVIVPAVDSLYPNSVTLQCNPPDQPE